MWLGWVLAARAEDAVIEVRGLSSDVGVVFCSLYGEPGGWLERGGESATVQVRPKGGAATCRFSGLPKGNYAVVFLHDLNGNSDMDFRFGLPTEPWGTSRDAAMWLGKPAWAESVFAVPGPAVVASAR